MANIMLNDYCNLNCSYCFAEMDDILTNISIEDFKEAVDFCLTDPNSNHIGLIGGEPTLHPKFSEILNFLGYNPNVKDVILFTNGITLDRHIDFLSKNDKFDILINCNSVNDIGIGNFSKLKHNVEMIRDYDLSKRTALGINLYTTKMDYSFIFELLESSSVDKLRISITVPNNLSKNKLNYQELKSIALQIVIDAIKNNIVPFFDCNKIPLCFVSNNERNTIFNLQKDAGTITNVICNRSICDPVIDIYPNLDAVRCMGTSDLCKVSIRDYATILDLTNYFIKHIDSYKHIVHLEKKCSDCNYNEQKKCSCGCISYKSALIKDLNSKIDRLY